MDQEASDFGWSYEMNDLEIEKLAGGKAFLAKRATWEAQRIAEATARANELQQAKSPSTPQAPMG